MVNKMWRKHINWTDYISERAMSTSITVNKQHVLLMSVYVTHSGYGTTTLKRCTDQSRNLQIPTRRTYKLWEGTSMPNWDLGYGVETCQCWTAHTQRGNKRGDWMKHWLMIQNFTAQRYLQDTKRYSKTVGQQICRQETHVLQQRR